MSSKNTSPFLVETWSVSGWTNGWTIAKPYQIGNTPFLFMLKPFDYGEDGNNVHINALTLDGKLGEKAFVKRWTEGWTCADFFTAETGKLYLLILKTSGAGSDGTNLHIDDVYDDGNIGGSAFTKTVPPGFNHARVYDVGGSKFLFLLRTSNGRAEIYRIDPNGAIGLITTSYDWPSGWSGVEFYQKGGYTFMLTIKSSNGSAHINKMTSDGIVGERVATYSWSKGWTNVKAFNADGRSYLLFLKSDTGTVHINKILDNGLVGESVCQYARNPDYTSAFETGSMAPWGPRPWNSGWTTIEHMTLGTSSYLFGLKRLLTGEQVKRAKIYSIHPMVSVGPMVSYVGLNEATIWIGLVSDASLAAVLCKKENGPTFSVDLQFKSGPDAYYRAGVANLTGLDSDTRYSYTVRVNGRVFGSGSFKTAPPRQRGKFTVAVVSCADLHDDRSQNVWDCVREQKPDLMLQIGDNAYANTTMKSMIWAEHLQQRGVQQFGDTVNHLPSLATWDDHDFGPNNSAGADVEEDNRLESQSTFYELFPGLPFASPQGIYYKAQWGDVDFFMLDVRFFRNHYDRGFSRNRGMLGLGQWNWLRSTLRSSDARFKIIVTGTTLAAIEINKNGFPEYVTETWKNNYPAEWNRLMELIRNNDGVFVVSGDIHKCRVAVHDLTPTRKLYEVISSGICGQYGIEHAFSTLTFDTASSGAEKVTVRFFRQDGTMRDDVRTISLSELE